MFVPKGPINNIPALVQIMAWRQPGDKPLSEAMMVSLLTHICVTPPQWVNGLSILSSCETLFKKIHWNYYSDVIMSTMTSQVTGVSVVYSTVCSGADQRKHQSSASLAFVQEIHRWSINSPHKGPVTRKMFPFDDVIMMLSANCRLTSYPSSSVLTPCGIPVSYSTGVIKLYHHCCLTASSRCLNQCLLIILSVGSCDMTIKKI